ncbi:reverse transcriptase domain-containing protein [Tanacetum coccineum]
MLRAIPTPPLTVPLGSQASRRRQPQVPTNFCESSNLRNLIILLYSYEWLIIILCAIARSTNEGYEDAISYSGNHAILGDQRGRCGQFQTKQFWYIDSDGLNQFDPPGFPPHSDPHASWSKPISIEEITSIKTEETISRPGTPSYFRFMRSMFLETSHALIDVYEGEITLRVGKEAITFNLDQTSRYTADLQPYDCSSQGSQVPQASHRLIPIDPKDQEKTTFTCPYGTFAYRRMPFGLCNAPGTFQRCMMAIFHDMIEKTMEVFMDDFSVFGDSFSSAFIIWDKMLEAV